MRKKKGMRREVRRAQGAEKKKQLELLLFLLFLLLLSMYFNIKFCCTHNFLPYLRFVICVCGFYCGALRFASVGGSGNCWYDREMCVHVYVFSLLHVACGMLHVHTRCSSSINSNALVSITGSDLTEFVCLPRESPLPLPLHTLSRGVPSWESLIALKDVNARRVLECVCARVCVCV